MKGRGAVWGAGLVAVGVLAGLVVAFVARGEGIAAAAALVDPTHGVTADVVKAVGAPQAPVALAAQGVTVQAPVIRPAAPSCNADAVAPVAKSEVAAPRFDARVRAEEVPVAKIIETKPIVSTYVAPVAPRVVHHVEAAQVAAVAPPPPVVREVAKPVAKASQKSAGNDLESASAADALAKAQLEAALSR